MTNIYLVRHGKSTLNIKEVYYGWTDCELSPEGIRQANHMKKTIQNIPYNYILSSPLKRALDTAKIIDVKNEILTDHRIKEINFGDWENKSFKQLQTLNSDTFNKWCNDWKNTAPPRGESFEDLYKRVVEFTDDLTHQYKDKAILIVAHQGVLRIIVSYLLKLYEGGYWHFGFEQGTYSHIEIDESNHTTIKCLNRR